MSQVALYRGQGAESVWVGDNGATFTNIGPDIVYYGDQNVSSTVNTGSIGVGSSVILTGSPYLVLAPTATRAYVNVAAVASSAGGGAGLPATILTKTADYTAAAGEFVQGDTTSAGFTVTLPPAPAAGALVSVKKIDSSAHTLTIVPSGGGTIDGDPNATTTTAWAGAVFEHVGSNVWRIAAAMQVTGPQGPTGPAGPTGSTGPQGPGGTISLIQDEGSDLTARSKLNFTGAGVTATDDSANGRTNVAITAAVAVPEGRAKSATTTYLSTPGLIVTGAGTQGMSANRAQYHPMRVLTPITIDQLTVEVTTAVAASTVRVAIYTANNDLQPTSLVVESGTIDSSTTGVKNVSITATALSAGLYMVWVNASAGGISLRSYNFQWGAFGFSTTAPSNSLTFVYTSQTYGAPPATGLAWDTVATGTPFGLLWVRESVA